MVTSKLPSAFKDEGVMLEVALAGTFVSEKFVGTISSGNITANGTVTYQFVVAPPVSR